MKSTLKKLTINDLKVGMKLTSDQIANLYGVWIYIEPHKDSENKYTVLYFCTDDTRDDSIINSLRDKGSISVIYQPQYLEDGDSEIYE